MKTKAVRLYGKDDLRLEEFDLPPIRDNEILARVVTDSLCMSSHKAAIQGPDHKRVPRDVDRNPVIIGHEFCVELLEVGARWKDKYRPGRKFSIQPAHNYKGTLSAPGYSYQYIGGDATHVIIPEEVMEMDCLLEYNGGGYFPASLAEPMSCIIGAFHASYHVPPGTYVHKMGFKPSGKAAILAGAGPMGLGAIDLALHGEVKPSLLVVTDIDEARLARAAALFPPQRADDEGVRLLYVNTAKSDNAAFDLVELSGGEGFDDVLVMAPVRPVVETGDAILARDGCLNFFAGPSNPDFRAELNFYDVHYSATHLVGTTGGNTEDMREALALMSEGRINPAGMITHVGGLDCVARTTMDLPKIPGGKKLIYTHISLPLTALSEFGAKAGNDARFSKLAEITDRNRGLWSVEAEVYLLANFK